MWDWDRAQRLFGRHRRGISQPPRLRPRRFLSASSNSWSTSGRRNGEDRRVPPRILVLALRPTGLLGRTTPWRRYDASPHSLLVAAVAVGAAFLASLIDNDYYLRILFMMGVYYLCAAGMNVLVGYAGQKSLGQAGLFAAGAYTAALLTTSLDLNPVVSSRSRSDRGGCVRRIDRLALVAGTGALSRHGDARIRDSHREVG